MSFFIIDMPMTMILMKDTSTSVKGPFKKYVTVKIPICIPFPLVTLCHRLP